MCAASCGGVSRGYGGVTGVFVVTGFIRCAEYPAAVSAATGSQRNYNAPMNYRLTIIIALTLTFLHVGVGCEQRVVSTRGVYSRQQLPEGVEEQSSIFESERRHK